MNDQIEGMFTSITASMVDLIVIVILDVIFLFLAKESSEMNHSLWIIFYYSAVRTRESYDLFTERKSGSQILKCHGHSKNMMIPTR